MRSSFIQAWRQLVADWCMRFVPRRVSWQQKQAGCSSSRVWQPWQLKMFFFCKSFLSFLTSYSTWRLTDESHHSSDPQRPPTRWDPSGKKHNYQRCWGFVFLTVHSIPERKSKPQTRNLSWCLKINVTSVRNYITFGKVWKVSIHLLLHKSRLVIILCSFV